MNMKRFVVGAVFSLLASALLSAQTAVVPVFVTSVGAVNGMTDPNRDNQDTAKDLRNALQDYKREIAIVDTRDAATIVLTVQSREKAQVTAGLFALARDCTVRIRFQFKETDTEMSASAQGGTLGSGGAWKKAAGKVAKQVREWVQTNRGKIVAQ